MFNPKEILDIVTVEGMDFDVTKIKSLVKEKKEKGYLEKEIEGILKAMEKTFSDDLNSKFYIKVKNFSKNGLEVLDKVILKSGLSLSKEKMSGW